jgi:hypothetical protein
MKEKNAAMQTNAATPDGILGENNRRYLAAPRLQIFAPSEESSFDLDI